MLHRPSQKEFPLYLWESHFQCCINVISFFSSIQSETYLPFFCSWPHLKQKEQQLLLFKEAVSSGKMYLSWKLHFVLTWKTSHLSLSHLSQPFLLLSSQNGAQVREKEQHVAHGRTEQYGSMPFLPDPRQK